VLEALQNVAKYTVIGTIPASRLPDRERSFDEPARTG
jgi:hypothetical protein